MPHKGCIKDKGTVIGPGDTIPSSDVLYLLMSPQTVHTVPCPITTILLILASHASAVYMIYNSISISSLGDKKELKQSQ